MKIQIELKPLFSAHCSHSSSSFASGCYSVYTSNSLYSCPNVILNFTVLYYIPLYMLHLFYIMLLSSIMFFHAVFYCVILCFILYCIFSLYFINSQLYYVSDDTLKLLASHNPSDSVLCNSVLVNIGLIKVSYGVITTII